MNAKAKQKFLLSKIILLIVLIIVIIAVFCTNFKGVRADKLPETARADQQISETWEQSVSIADGVAALLFYAPDGADSTFSLYTENDGYGTGYFFRAGGSLSTVQEGILEQVWQTEKSTAYGYYSMNTVGAVSAVYGDGITMPLTPGQPFALALSDDYGPAVFYDADGDRIPTIR